MIYFKIKKTKERNKEMKEDRAAMYKFLSIGFTYPQEGFSEILNKSVQLMSEHYTRLNKQGYRLSGIKKLKSGLKELSKLKTDNWQEIYTSLFVSNFPKTPLHPYESFYKEGLLVSESSDEIVEIYKDCGVEIFDDKEFPDLINLELEFASFIVENQEGCLPVYNEFFNNHLFSWIFDFFKDVEGYKKTPLFYSSLAKIGNLFLQKEKKVIARLTDER